MSELFLTVLNMSLTASYVILCVVLIRLFLKKAPKFISYALWGVVAFRLVVPFSFESVFSLLPRNSNTVPIPHEIIYQQSPQINSGIGAVDTFVNKSLPAATVEASANPLQIYMEIGSYIWVLGIIALLAYSLVSVLKLKRQLKSAKLIEQNVYRAENLKTPFVLGLIRPKIYLPAGLNDTEKSYILLHEKTHIRRNDHIIKVLAFLILSVHWFNPLVWIAFRLMSTDMELSCDERVLKEMKEEIKKPYANLLLSLAAGRHFLSGSPLAFGEGNVKARIKNVLSYNRPRFWVSVLSLVIITAVGIGLMANPAKSESNSGFLSFGIGKKADDFSAYPKDYTVEQGLKDGFFVILHGEAKGGSQSLLYKFIGSIENKKPANLKILQYTIEGDPLFVGLTYKGGDKPITATFDNTRDEFGNQSTITSKKGEYLKLFKQEDSVNVYLTDKEDLTLEEAINGSSEGIFICSFRINDTISDNDLEKKNKSDGTVYMPGFTEEEVAAARAVVEEYFRAVKEKDDEAILKTLNPKYKHNVLYGEEIRTLLSIEYIEDDPIRQSYVESGKGRYSGIDIENVIVFRVSFNVKYPEGASGSFSEGDYPDWSVILIRENRESLWYIDGQGV